MGESIGGEALNPAIVARKHLLDKGWKMLWGAGSEPFYWHREHTAPHKKYMTLQEAYSHQLAIDEYERLGVLKK